MNIVFFYPFKFCCCVFAPLLPNVFQCEHPRICCTLRALLDIFVLSLLRAPSELTISLSFALFLCSSCLFSDDLGLTSVLSIVREIIGGGGFWSRLSFDGRWMHLKCVWYRWCIITHLFSVTDPLIFRVQYIILPISSPPYLYTDTATCIIWPTFVRAMHTMTFATPC